jgi:NAD+ kinase
MERIVLCPNPHRDEGLAVTVRTKAALEKEGFEVLVSPVYGDAGKVVEETPLSQAVKGASLLVTLGGDGTILRVAPAVMAENVPILGVNLGHKGFLAELERGDLDMLVAAVKGRREVIPRMMIDVCIYHGGRAVFADTALNDAVINGVVRSVHLTAFDGDNRIISFSGDGIILCTPTGSTGYCMSAGGPLAEPGGESIILTPICAHDLAARSFVLGSDKKVTVRPDALEGRRCILSVDGRNPIDLCDGDEIVVTKSEYKTLLVHVGTKSFYDTAFEKLGERT